MIHRTELLKSLQRELPTIEKDILAYSESRTDLIEHLNEEYQKAKNAGRTAEHFVAWREAQITQAAVSWLLTCVFVRFLEDNQLIQEPMLSGPVQTEEGSKSLQHAKERMVVYFNDNPTHSEREYLLSLFEQLEQFPVIAELLDHRHNPLWQILVSADGAKQLIDFFQNINPETGEIVHDFTDPNWDTRFLGDLYQDLSESVRKRYALLQTPEFVESFILDYTLEKAKETFGLKGLRLIDPTCGSGHFLLTTFERVFNDWIKREPSTNTRELAQRALDVVHGVDINPYAIAICRFRLLIVAMKVSGTKRIKDAPDFHFNLACGDSLLHGRRFEWQGQGIQTELIDDDPIKHVLEVEDKDKLAKILGQQYHVVVGNPPYIIVKDKALNEAYRNRYSSCYRKYSLTVPFMERFFDLCVSDCKGGNSGFIGKITANSFSKREFGKKLVSEYLPMKDITSIVDTSGAYIPGHATPTLILFARNQNAKKESVLSILGGQGEPGIPIEPSKGKVWTSILEYMRKGSGENKYITCIERSREIYLTHPWSLNGGGESDIKESLDKTCKSTLSSKLELIGFGTILGEDEAFTVPKNKSECSQIPKESRPVIEGEVVRDWCVSHVGVVVYPYDSKVNLKHDLEIVKWLWALKPLLFKRPTFGKKTYKEVGRCFYEYHQIPKDRNKKELSLTFASVATQNHFSLNKFGNVLKQSSPILLLKDDSTIEDYLSLLGLLNSSLASFWMKQVFMDKGNGGIGGGIGDERWERRFDHDGTKLKKFPLMLSSSQLLSSYGKLVNICKRMVSLVNEYKETSPDIAYGMNVPDKTFADENRSINENILSQMIYLQEEIDWHVYFLYGLIDEDITLNNDSVTQNVNLGERAFEISLSREIDDTKKITSWFERHNSQRTSVVPSHWDSEYLAIVEKRLDAIKNNKVILVIESMTYKRRWNKKEYLEREKIARDQWFLRKIEFHLKNQVENKLITVAQVIDKIMKEEELIEVLSTYDDMEFGNIRSYISQLINSDSCAQIACCRLKSAGIVKYRAWQQTWEKQRIEDAIDVEFGVDKPLSVQDAKDPEKLAQYKKAKQQADNKKMQVVGDVPVPPKYTSSDFRKASYWPLRGKLDVPKERFFSLPGCEKDGDSTLVIGWAGMNHLQRAQAIAAWYIERKETEGWEAEKLKPMLVALDELIPWLKQWHNEMDPEYGERMGDFYEGFLLEELRLLDISRDELLSWEPPVAPKKKRATKKKKSVVAE